MSKRARHTGSIEPRGKSSFRLRYWLPVDGKETRTQATETVRGSRKDAERVMRERLSAVQLERVEANGLCADYHRCRLAGGTAGQLFLL